ncbi:MAG: 16S rRNA (adenine(1518)-N(6)/adenine(1519)-N(6))-dimethyltransferase RsmA [Flavobacteriia bacterium]|jgi:16S rRNA (adenine1518-N6/adenine1519-N6)-dimethyltransferase|nr:16S rRNA (adenine(1518)-N(6)/adenine(1519)-N(6))-dimethyltransferase RsmA [Flavobacteriia bacterium]NDD79668.1 16S rRNA (adenine(1518)-N(6)/adenine(1519)-N(6))-dimethyltransferase RsmA [Flavobacteriia bacterium]
MAEIRAKKALGQHFLRDLSAAERIADALSLEGYAQVLEVGPGTGVLTQYLLPKAVEVHAIELDRESIPVLQSKFPSLSARLYQADILRWTLVEPLATQPFALVGNYPYNISTQIVFWMIDRRAQIPEMVGMFQKEVAERIAAGPGSKVFGITSVLTQAYYDVEYLFTLDEGAFDPPPKVKSGVIRCVRKAIQPDVHPKHLALVVKTAFNQRRKTLRNALKSLNFVETGPMETLAQQRAEQLSVNDFIALAKSMTHGLPDHSGIHQGPAPTPGG